MSFGLSGQVVKILNHVLGSFVEDIDKSQFDMSLFSGKVTLRNISVRSSVFDNFPIPFKLVYGKVGLIDVDVPVMSLFSSPLKIRIDDVFVLIKPMETSEWKEEREIDCFKKSTQSMLSHLEEYFDSKEEIEKSEPGMMSKMLSNILDNLQIEISNMCIRYEDKLSNPKMPFCLGITIQNLSTYTANDDWNKEFITDKDICNKVFKLTSFSSFLNFREHISYKEITKNFDPDKLTGDIHEEYLSLKRKDSNGALEIAKYKYFISPYIQSELHNSYLITNFGIEARLKLNKNPKFNLLPQIDLDIIFGGEFESTRSKSSKIPKQSFQSAYQQQQLILLLKFLEYSGYFTKFQDFVLKPYYDRDLTNMEVEKYIEMYVDYKHYKNLPDNKYTKQKVEELIQSLKDFEQNFSYEKLAPVRQIAYNKAMYEKRKEENRKEIDQKIEEFKSTKKGVFKSVKGFFGFSSKQKEQDDLKEIENYQNELDSKFLEKYGIEEEKLNKEIENFIEKRGTFDPEIIENMPGNWVRFKFNLCVPQFKFALTKMESTYDNILKIFEITISNFFIRAEIAREFEVVNVGLKEGNIIDYVSGDTHKGVYMFENVSTQKDKNAIEIVFSHHAKEAIPIKISAKTNAEFYIFLNIPCIKEIEKFFTSHMKVGKIDLSYYAEQAKIKFLKYLNRSIDYLETIESDKIKSMNIELNVKLSSPKIMLRDPRDFINKWFILNLGTITMGTSFIESSRLTILFMN